MEKTSLDQPIFAGISTFMRSPYVRSPEELENYDIGVVGIPLDYGASYREGARHAPRAIREHSHWDDLDGGQYIDLDKDTVIAATPHSIADIGDITVYPTDPERTNRLIEASVAEVRRHAFPLILGGDHSITYAGFKGCKKALKDDEQPMGILHFDAHTDVEKEFGVMPRIWHGNPFRALIEEGEVSPENLVTVGPRGVIPKKWIDYIREKQIRLFTTAETRERGLSKVIDDAIAYLRSRCASVYVTFDIDVIDPSQAPGTGTPCVGGLRAEELLPEIRKLSSLPVRAFDLVEVNPVLDPTGQTSIVACEILWNYLAFGLTSRKQP